MLVFSLMRLDLLRPFELYVVDGAHGIRSLSQGWTRSDIGPIWSPDGTQLAYQSVSGGGTRYHLVDAEGGNRREITPDDRRKALARWSPDGSRLAYLAYDRSAEGVATLDAAALCVTHLGTATTDQAPVAGDIQDLVWVPDGSSLLALVRGEGLVWVEAYGARGEYEGRRAEVDHLREAHNITLSPDARKVAYTAPATEGEGDPVADALYVSALDGSVATLVGTTRLEGDIVWSPDSTRIAFVALNEDWEYALYVANADGTGMHPLMLIHTGDESGEMLPAAPTWSPDGRRLAISSVSSPNAVALLVMNVDGTERRQVLTVDGIGVMIYDLAWRPAPWKRIRDQARLGWVRHRTCTSSE